MSRKRTRYERVLGWVVEFLTIRLENHAARQWRRVH